MKKIYEAENPALVWSARVALENAGLRCTIRNEFAAAANGLLAPIETWPELWVEDKYAERAQQVLSDLRGHATCEWVCGACGEVNDGSFEVCWKCETGA